MNIKISIISILSIITITTNHNNANINMADRWTGRWMVDGWMETSVFCKLTVHFLQEFNNYGSTIRRLENKKAIKATHVVQTLYVPRPHLVCSLLAFLLFKWCFLTLRT